MWDELSHFWMTRTWGKITIIMALVAVVMGFYNAGMGALAFDPTRFVLGLCAIIIPPMIVLSFAHEVWAIDNHPDD